jgi:hypothetical protein
MDPLKAKNEKKTYYYYRAEAQYPIAKMITLKALICK